MIQPHHIPDDVSALTALEEEDGMDEQNGSYLG